MDNIREKIAIVIVLYNTPLENSITFRSLTACLEDENSSPIDLIVYDNSKNNQVINHIDFLMWNITYIHDESNPGVSKAYNEAAKIAYKSGKLWILLTDQDTKFPKQSISRYIEGVKKHFDVKIFVPYLKSGEINFSPSKYYFSRGFIWKKPDLGIHSFRNKSLLNSGIFVNLDAFNSIGGYNEKVQLYFSDFDFVNRFKRIHPNFCLVDITCKHELSDVVKVDRNAAEKRFYYYCEGGYQSSCSRYNFMQLFITIFLRSLKLSLKYKDLVFLRIFSKRFIA
jgi:GT2 family glycosyltransferase